MSRITLLSLKTRVIAARKASPTTLLLLNSLQIITGNTSRKLTINIYQHNLRQSASSGKMYVYLPLLVNRPLDPTAHRLPAAPGKPSPEPATLDARR